MELRTLPVHTAIEGDGFEVNRPFPVPGLSHIDPFLLIDQIGPKMITPGKETGTPWHPHRGFETVTYIISGSGNHRDTMGNHGVLAPGDVQWMTAGSGVLHKEGPDPDAQTGENEEEMFGVQLWVNLPASKKMMDPQYQDVRGSEMPTTEIAGFRIKLIAGKAFGLSAQTQTQTPITYAHLSHQVGMPISNTKASTTLDPLHNVIVNPLVGSATGRVTQADGDEVQEFSISKGTALTFSGAKAIEFDESDLNERVEILLLTGEPIGEPVARYGPFVMNTEEELVQAFEDFRAGKMGVAPE